MILIKYATRGRPLLFKKAINNIYNTMQSNAFRVIISADIDDLSMNNNYIRSFVSGYNNCQIFFGKSESKVHAINRDMENVDKFKILVNMSDDMVFVIKGWDIIVNKDVIKYWGDSTDFFAHYSDGYVAGKLPTMSIMGYDYYKRDNYIYHPNYKSFSCDAEAMFVAMMRGKYRYFGDNKILFKHVHPANDRNIKNDEIYKKNSLVSDHDIITYWKRLNKYFDIPLNQRFCDPIKEYVGTNLHLI